MTVADALRWCVHHDRQRRTDGDKGDVDWAKVRAAGCEFAIVKATEGQGFRDARFTQGRGSAMKTAGLVRGAYHFARPSNGASDPVGEAHDFLAAVHDAGGLHPGDLPLALDLEATKLGPHDTFLTHELSVTDVAFSPDGSQIATACHDGSVRVRDIDVLRELTFTHEWSVNGVMFSPDSNQIATASTPGSACVWGVASGREL